MKTLASQYKEEVLRELDGLPSEKIKEILDFVCFIKAREAIDPTQAYFWTRKWQEMENEADKDKERDNIIGNGPVENLIESLKNENKSLQEISKDISESTKKRSEKS